VPTPELMFTIQLKDNMPIFSQNEKESPNQYFGPLRIWNSLSGLAYYGDTNISIAVLGKILPSIPGRCEVVWWGRAKEPQETPGEGFGVVL